MDAITLIEEENKEFTEQADHIDTTNHEKVPNSVVKNAANVLSKMFLKTCSREEIDVLFIVVDLNVESCVILRINF